MRSRHIALASLLAGACAQGHGGIPGGRPPTAAIPIAGPAPVAAPPAAAATEPGLVVDQVLAAHGGPGRLAAVRGYRAEGTVIARLRNGSGLVTRTYSRPDQLDVVVDYGNRREVRLVIGDRGWRGDGSDTLQPASGPPLAAMQLQAARAALPWLLEDRRRDVRIGERLPGAAGDVVRLDVEVGPGLTLQVFVDASTGRIESTIGFMDANPAIRFETRYEEYRSFDGILLPVKEENFASGSHTATTTLDVVILDPPIP